MPEDSHGRWKDDVEDFRRAGESLDRLLDNPVLMGSLSVVQRKTLQLIRQQTDTNHHVAQLQEQAARENP